MDEKVKIVGTSLLHKIHERRKKRRTSKIEKKEQATGTAMANYNFRPTNREQGFLMPPSMKEWLPEDDLVFD